MSLRRRKKKRSEFPAKPTEEKLEEAELESELEQMQEQELAPEPEPVTYIEPDKVVVEDLTRRRVRNLLFRIRDNRVENPDVPLAKVLWDCIEAQLPRGASVADFTFKWDLSPDHPLTVILPSDWSRYRWRYAPNTVWLRVGIQTGEPHEHGEDLFSDSNKLVGTVAGGALQEGHGLWLLPVSPMAEPAEVKPGMVVRSSSGTRAAVMQGVIPRSVDNEEANVKPPQAPPAFTKQG